MSDFIKLTKVYSVSNNGDWENRITESMCFRKESIDAINTTSSYENMTCSFNGEKRFMTALILKNHYKEYYVVESMDEILAMMENIP